MSNEVSLLKNFSPYIVALATFLGVYIAASFTFKANNKNIFIKTVTDERAKWRDDFRNICGEFSKLVYEETHCLNANESNKARINELKVHMKVRLNPSSDSKHKLDQAIIQLSQNITLSLDRGYSKKRIMFKLRSLENNIQELLKQEWEKGKKEAIKGRLDGATNTLHNHDG